MIFLLRCAVIFVAFSATVVQAAEIKLHRSTSLNLISIEGEIKIGDAEKFKRLALSIETGVVALNSPGGALGPALEIGRAIQIAGFSTYVSESTVCTSSCALIWVAGAKRLLARSARVGFHASYRDNKGKLEEVGVANAMVGRYLTLLNLPERAVIFATAASPDKILWLETDGTDRSAIDFKVFDPDSASTGGSSQVSASRVPAPPPIQTRPIGQSNTSSAASIPQWYFFEEDGDGSVYYVRGQDVANGSSTSRQVKFWIKSDDSKNKKYSHRSTMARYNLDCVAETFKNESFVMYDANGNATEATPSYRVESVIPDTIFALAAELVCSDNLPMPDERDLP